MCDRNQNKYVVRGHRRRSGLTLVEMMVSVVLTLMVVFAVVRVFETLGASVTDGRATIEMSGSLRTAAQLLQSDLDGATTTTLPPRQPGQAEGYLEIGDGAGTDSAYPAYNAGDLSRVGNPSLNMIDVVDSDGFLDGTAHDTTVGDVDDFLALTSHREDEPFTGVMSDPRIRKGGVNGDSYLDNDNGTFADSSDDIPIQTLTMESQDAEIVWWLQVERIPSAVANLTRLNELRQKGSDAANWQQQINYACYADRPADTGDPQLYPNNITPVRSLHRRVLLILPHLNMSDILLYTPAEVDQFLSNNDISVRVIESVDAAGKRVWRVQPNSLADLTKRENRAYRPTWAAVNARERARISRSRMMMVRSNGVTLDPNTQLLRQAAMKDMIIEHQSYELRLAMGVVTTQPRVVTMLRKGRDVVLNDVLGFDLQLWDPEALVLPNNGNVVVPSDPGYFAAVATNQIAVSKGAFVDLGFGILPKTTKEYPLGYHGNFGGRPWSKSALPVNDNMSGAGLIDGLGVATYCTWSDSYEHDGFNNVSTKKASLPPFDLGNDGIDNDGANGVDDPGERETSPPYAHPLLGLKVTLRSMDFGTRQVRQTSVVHDFLAE